MAGVRVPGVRGTPGRPSELRKRKKQATRLAISQAADVLFTAQGYRHTSIDDIAAAAGVSRRTFFAYFPSKADLLLVRVDEPKERFLESFRAWTPDIPLVSFSRELSKETLKGVIGLLEPIGAADGGELERIHAKVVSASRTRWIHWEDRLTATIRDATGLAMSDPRPRIAASMILGAIRAAAEVTDSAELGTEPIDYRERDLSTAFDLVEPSLSRLLAPGGSALSAASPEAPAPVEAVPRRS